MANSWGNRDRIFQLQLVQTAALCEEYGFVQTWRIPQKSPFSEMMHFFRTEGAP